MPMYPYTCSRCKCQVEVVRPVDRRDVAPDADDGAPDCTSDEGHAWVRGLNRGLVAVAGPSWGPGKGGW